MEGFHYRKGIMYADDCNLEAVAAGTDTPAYVYSAGLIRSRYRKLCEAFDRSRLKQPLIAYACKASGNQAILRLLAKMGAGADIVSGGELERCLAAGIDANKIVFSGVSKSDDEIALAIKNGIRQINIESEYELGRVSEISSRLGIRANIAFRLNPDCGAGGHEKITTGRAQDKFGLLRADIDRLYGEAAGRRELNVRGLQTHIGSQITDVGNYRKPYEILTGLAKDLIARGLPLDTLDLGGGLGVVYDGSRDRDPDLDAYTAIIADTADIPGVEMVIEPGRFIVANSAVLLARLLYVKESGGRKFAVLDAGMNDLVRPAMYESFHAVLPVRERSDDTQVYDIVGPVCESGDTFARQRVMPELKGGDLLAIMSAGAYGASMTSNYNTRPMPPEVMVDGDRLAVIRKRQSVSELIERDIVPEWV